MCTMYKSGRRAVKASGGIRRGIFSRKARPEPDEGALRREVSAKPKKRLIMESFSLCELSVGAIRSMLKIQNPKSKIQNR
jgi:hypothetical protein